MYCKINTNCQDVLSLEIYIAWVRDESPLKSGMELLKYTWRQMPSEDVFPNAMKTTWDVGKTMSDVGKIMSDIIRTTSDLFPPDCKPLKYRRL